MDPNNMMSKKYHTILYEYDGDILHVAQVSEFISNRLYFMTINDEKGTTTVQKFRDWKTALNEKDIFFLNVDDVLVYNSINFDFGPYNLGAIFRYVCILRKKLNTYKRVVHCTHIKNRKQTSNGVFLMCAYLIIEENWTAEQAYSVCSQQNKYHYKPFRDATNTNTRVEKISVKDCLNALYKAKWFGFFDFSDFDLNEFEYYSNPTTGGDIAWILPDSLLAFPSPCSVHYVHRCNGKSACSHIRHPPEFYYKYFNDNDIKQIVRLNSKVKYNAEETFVAAANIRHIDMSFPDGFPPSKPILESFLRLCERYIDNDTKSEFEEEQEGEIDEMYENDDVQDIIPLNRGAVAVHCRAGLGRTGCLIASYIIKHWPLTANEAIAWVRICRPGSIFGVQQQWLIRNERNLKLAGQLWHQKMKIPIERYKCYQNGIYSIRRKRSIAINAYEYVDEPPEMFDLDIAQPSANNRDHVQSENLGQIESPTVLDLNMAANVRNPVQMNEHVLDLSVKKTSPLNHQDNGQSKPLLPSNKMRMNLRSSEVVNVLNEAILPTKPWQQSSDVFQLMDCTK